MRHLPWPGSEMSEALPGLTLSPQLSALSGVGIKLSPGGRGWRRASRGLNPAAQGSPQRPAGQWSDTPGESGPEATLATAFPAGAAVQPGEGHPWAQRACPADEGRAGRERR